MRQIIFGIGLLVQHVITVLFVGEDTADGCLPPAFHTLGRTDTLFCEGICDFLRRRTFQKALEDVFHNTGLGWLHLDPAGIIPIVSDGVPDREFVQALLHTVAYAFFDCDALLLAFKLCQSRKDRNHQLVFAVTGIDPLGLKIDSHRRRQVAQLA